MRARTSKGFRPIPTWMLPYQEQCRAHSVKEEKLQKERVAQLVSALAWEVRDPGLDVGAWARTHSPSLCVSATTTVYCICAIAIATSRLAVQKHFGFFPR